MNTIDPKVGPPSTESMWVQIRNAFITFWNFLEKRYIVRRALVLMTIYITLTSYDAAWDVIEKSLNINSMNVAAMIAAVLTPLSALQAFTLKYYFYYSPDNMQAQFQAQLRSKENDKPNS